MKAEWLRKFYVVTQSHAHAIHNVPYVIGVIHTTKNVDILYEKYNNEGGYIRNHHIEQLGFFPPTNPRVHLLKVELQPWHIEILCDKSPKVA